ncbi:MAG: hypothetical protein JXA15_07450 [Spirochaetales bacterium]|nr:hypothetical protein [Spirochaetales bacterium]
MLAKLRPVLFTLAMALLVWYAGAQEAAPAPAAPGGAAAGAAASADAAPAPSSGPAASSPVPRGFRGIELGMGFEEVTKLLLGEALLYYRGEPDVSLLPRPAEMLLDVSGAPRSFLERAWFQFYEGKLWTMTFVMDEGRVDHYSIFTQLSTKYGKPGELSPKASVWEDGSTRMSLERPLSVKYIDLAVFAVLQGASSVELSVEELDRGDFIGSF